MQQADRVMVCSRSMINEVISLFHAAPAKLSLIPNGIRIHTKNMTACNGKPPALTGKTVSPQTIEEIRANPVVLFLGRLVYEKGIHILLQAMRMLKENYPEALLVIAGAGPMETELQQLAEPLKQTVRFLGFVPKAELPRLFSEADLCVVPSLYEPFGLVALEAMSSGIPLIVADTGGLGELIDHGITGWKVPPGDTESLAILMRFVLDHPQQASQAARRALIHVQNRYTTSRMAKQVSCCYKELLESVSSRNRKLLNEYSQ